MNLFVYLLVISGINYPPTASAGPQVDDVGGENHEFWDRFLRRYHYNDESMSMVRTPSPTSDLTRHPTMNKDQTKTPAQGSTDRPTIRSIPPTPDPTKRPTKKDQTKRPTPYPTRRGMTRPTPDPTQYPTKINDKTLSPTVESSRHPTLTYKSLSCQIDLLLDCRLYDHTSCKDIRLRHDNCPETLYFKIEISNVESVDFLVLLAALMFQDDGFDLSDQLHPNPLAPGQRMILSATATLDVCRPEVFEAIAIVDAVSPNGSNCEAHEVYKIVVSKKTKTDVPTPRTTMRPYPKLTHKPSHVQPYEPTPKLTSEHTVYPTQGPIEMPRLTKNPTQLYNSRTSRGLYG